ncbi:hypothetical protein [Phormidesmis sp. 146-33]
MTWVQSPELGSSLIVSSERRVNALPATPEPLFKVIPPERVGVDGEYDHSGLAKRVSLAFCEQFEAKDLDRLQVTQRGRVVVLIGRVFDQQTLTQLVDVALEVYGTATVETQGVKVDQHRDSPKVSPKQESR